MVIGPQKRSRPPANIGTIGAAEHGKTTLTAAISKVLHDKYPDINPFTPSDQIDEGPEEKLRGLTINIAHAEYHTPRRRYVLGGAVDLDDMITGLVQMDGAILVVAATDGPTAQTREHVLLARHVGVPYLVVALDKADMVEDEEILELVEMEVRELLSAQGFDGDNAPVVRVSGLKALEGDPEWTKSVEELLEAVDESIPEPVRDMDKPFLMSIEDVFTVAGRGTVVTGMVLRGRLPINSEIEIVGTREPRKATVIGIEMFRRQMDEAWVGEYCGLLLRGVEREEVERGQVVAKPGTITPHTNFEAQVYVLAKDEGGRHNPFYSNYRPQFYFRTTDVTGDITLPAGTDEVRPGDSVRLSVRLREPAAVEEGLRFAIREDGRTVGVGVVTRILGKQEEAVALLGRVEGAVRELRELEEDLDAVRIAAELGDGARDEPATVTALLYLILGGLVIARYGLESALRPTASLERRRAALAILDLWDGALDERGRSYVALLPQSYATLGIFAGDPSERIDSSDDGVLGDVGPDWLSVGWRLRAMSDVDDEWRGLWRQVLQFRRGLGIDLGLESRRSPRVRAVAASAASLAVATLRSVQLSISPSPVLGQLVEAETNSWRAVPEGRGHTGSGPAPASSLARERRPVVTALPPRADRGPDAEGQALSEFEQGAEPGARVRVWFGTNRRPAMVRGTRAPAIFGNRRDSETLHLGACDVSVPIGHRFGSTGSSLWRTWFLGSPRDEMLTIEEVHLFDTATEFASALVADFAGAAPADRRALVYLHGYNTSFRQAALRAAQIGFDLHVEGAVAFYSWPSLGHPLAYPADTQAAQASEDHFVEFLEILGSRAGVTRIDFLVHSLGNQLFARAAARLVAAAGRAGVPSGSLIMAAPDIDRDVFSSLARIYPQIASNRTMYVSSRDRALWLSKWIQQDARAGYTPPVTIVDGVDTVHVADVDVSTLGHGYYAGAGPVLYDIKGVLDGLGPDRRIRLVPREYNGRGYWSLRA